MIHDAPDAVIASARAPPSELQDADAVLAARAEDLRREQVRRTHTVWDACCLDQDAAAYERASALATARRRKQDAASCALVVTALALVLVWPWTVTMAVGFIPLDATHTRLSRLLCIAQEPSAHCGGLNGPAFAIVDARNASVRVQPALVCGCTRFAQTTPAHVCTSGLAYWFTRADGDAALSSYQCSYPPTPLWISAAALTAGAAALCAALWLVAYLLPRRGCSC